MHVRIIERKIQNKDEEIILYRPDLTDNLSASFGSGWSSGDDGGVFPIPEADVFVRLIGR